MMPSPATPPSNKNKHTTLEAELTQSRWPTQELQAEKGAKEQDEIEEEGKKTAY